MNLEERLLSEDLKLNKLDKTTRIKSDETNSLLKIVYKFYNSKTASGRPHVSNQLMASIINSCCTQLLSEFLLSFKTFNILLKADTNLIGRNGCNSQEYKLFMSQMKEQKILEVVEAPGSHSSCKEENIRAKAGIYRILIPEVLEYIENKKNDFKNSITKMIKEPKKEYLPLITSENNTKIEKPQHKDNCDCGLCAKYYIHELVNKKLQADINYE